MRVLAQYGWRFRTTAFDWLKSGKVVAYLSAGSADGVTPFANVSTFGDDDTRDVAAAAGAGDASFTSRAGVVSLTLSTAVYKTQNTIELYVSINDDRPHTHH